MGKITDVSLRERMIYKAIEAQLKKEFPDSWQNFLISPGYLRAEKALSSTSANYTFDLKKNGNEIATELKLDRNDRFVISRIGLFLTNQAAASIGKEVLQSYPNIIAFPAVAGSVAADLEAIYNGYSSLKIGSKVNIENLSNQEFRYVSGTAQSAATNRTEINLSDATYKPAAMISLHGTMDITWTTQFPTYAGIGLTPTDAATNGTNKLVLMPFGFLIKGAAINK